MGNAWTSRRGIIPRPQVCVPPPPDPPAEPTFPPSKLWGHVIIDEAGDGEPPYDFDEWMWFDVVIPGYHWAASEEFEEGFIEAKIMANEAGTQVRGSIDLSGDEGPQWQGSSGWKGMGGINPVVTGTIECEPDEMFEGVGTITASE